MGMGETFSKDENEWAKKKVCPRCGVTRAYPRDFAYENTKTSKNTLVCFDCLDVEDWDERYTERGY